MDRLVGVLLISFLLGAVLLVVMLPITYFRSWRIRKSIFADSNLLKQTYGLSTFLPSGWGISRGYLSVLEDRIEYRRIVFTAKTIIIPYTEIIQVTHSKHSFLIVVGQDATIDIGSSVLNSLNTDGLNSSFSKEIFVRKKYLEEHNRNLNEITTFLESKAVKPPSATTVQLDTRKSNIWQSVVSLAVVLGLSMLIVLAIEKYANTVPTANSNSPTSQPAAYGYSDCVLEAAYEDTYPPFVCVDSEGRRYVKSFIPRSGEVPPKIQNWSIHISEENQYSFRVPPSIDNESYRIRDIPSYSQFMMTQYNSKYPIRLCLQVENIGDGVSSSTYDYFLRGDNSVLIESLGDGYAIYGEKSPAGAVTKMYLSNHGSSNVVATSNNKVLAIFSSWNCIEGDGGELDNDPEFDFSSTPEYREVLLAFRSFTFSND